MALVVDFLVFLGLMVLYFTCQEAIDNGIKTMLNGIIHPKIDVSGIKRRIGHNWPLICVMAGSMVIALILSLK
jgi:hypothetical protein